MAAATATAMRRASSRRGSRSSEHNHHVQQVPVSLVVLDEGAARLGAWCRDWVSARLEEQLGPGWSRWVLTGAVTLTTALLALLFALVDVVCAYAQLCSVPVPFFALMSGYLLLALALRKSWTPTGIYITFCGSVAGELIGLFLTSAFVQSRQVTCSLHLGQAQRRYLFSIMPF